VPTPEQQQSFFSSARNLAPFLLLAILVAVLGLAAAGGAAIYFLVRTNSQQAGKSAALDPTTSRAKQGANLERDVQGANLERDVDGITLSILYIEGNTDSRREAGLMDMIFIYVLAENRSDTKYIRFLEKNTVISSYTANVTDDLGNKYTYPYQTPFPAFPLTFGLGPRQHFVYQVRALTPVSKAKQLHIELGSLVAGSPKNCKLTVGLKNETIDRKQWAEMLGTDRIMGGDVRICFRRDDLEQWIRSPDSSKIMLRNIHAMYSSKFNRDRKPPSQLSDLTENYDVIYPTTIKALKAGNYVVVWGISDRDGNKVLAYEKDVPAQGGEVLMSDGSVKTMTADEFKAKKPAP
jgi:hypothetical protein